MDILQGMFVYLISGVNKMITLGIFLSLGMLLWGLITVFRKKRREIAIATCLFSTVLAGFFIAALYKNAFHEASLDQYAYLIHKANQHPKLNQEFVTFVKNNDNRIDGVGYVVISKRLDQIEANELVYSHTG